MVRRLEDWFEEFEGYITAKVNAPPRFAQWASYSALAAALGRRVWTVTRAKPIYPNLYILLVAPPGGGKSETISCVHDVLRNNVQFADNSTTREAFINQLAHPDSYESFFSDPTKEQPQGEHNGQRAIYVANGEMRILLRNDDEKIWSDLADLYTCPSPWSYRTIKRGKESMDSPIVNILGGVQDRWFAGGIPANIHGSGFTARFIPVYAEEFERRPFFQEEDNSLDRRRNDIRHDLEEILVERKVGGISWTKDAQIAYQKWDDGDQNPKPNGLDYINEYCTRREEFIPKLAMLHAISYHLPAIDIESLTWAFDNLYAVEHDFDQALLYHSSNPLYISGVKIIEWVKKEGGTVTNAELYRFVARELDLEQVGKVMLSLQREGRIVLDGDKWKLIENEK